MKLVAISLLLTVAGCATAPIIDFATPASISIRYDPALVGPQEAGVTAQNHCQKYGKNAAITNRQGGGIGWATMSFDCR